MTLSPTVKMLAPIILSVLLDQSSFMDPIHEPFLSTHDAPSPYRPPHKWAFWVLSPMPGCHPCGHPPLPTRSLTWSHCPPSLAPPWCVRLTTFCGPPAGLGPEEMEGKGRRGEGRGKKEKRRAMASFWYQLILTSVCSLSPQSAEQSATFHPTFMVLREFHESYPTASSPTRAAQLVPPLML